MSEVWFAVKDAMASAELIAPEALRRDLIDVLKSMGAVYGSGRQATGRADAY